MGPFDYWPTGYGFEYFYGFLAGEASQYEPHLVAQHDAGRAARDRRKGYHLTEDIAEDAIKWLARTTRLRSRTSRSSCTGRPARRMARIRS